MREGGSGCGRAAPPPSSPPPVCLLPTLSHSPARELSRGRRSAHAFLLPERGRPRPVRDQKLKGDLRARARVGRPRWVRRGVRWRDGGGRGRCKTGGWAARRARPSHKRAEQRHGRSGRSRRIARAHAGVLLLCRSTVPPLWLPPGPKSWPVPFQASPTRCKTLPMGGGFSLSKVREKETRLGLCVETGFETTPLRCCRSFVSCIRCL